MRIAHDTLWGKKPYNYSHVLLPCALMAVTRATNIGLLSVTDHYTACSIATAFYSKSSLNQPTMGPTLSLNGPLWEVVSLGSSNIVTMGNNLGPK